jgi:hypothetical protein
MRAARIYRPAELVGRKINHLQVQACHDPAKGCLLGRGQRRHTRATQPRLGRACGRGDRGELHRSPRICPEQEGRYLGRRPAVNRCWSDFAPSARVTGPIPNRRYTESIGEVFEVVEPDPRPRRGERGDTAPRQFDILQSRRGWRAINAIMRAMGCFFAPRQLADDFSWR